MNRYVLTLLLTLCFVPLLACAQPVSRSPAVSTVSAAENALMARNNWQEDQKLLRASVAVETVKDGKLKQTQWMFMERTPHHRLKVIFRSNPASDKDQLTYLNHDHVVLVVKEEDIAQPLAPWMVGTFLFGETLDPSLVMSWILGVPGKSYSVENHEAEIGFNKNALSFIRQEGWSVNYHTWNLAQENVPSLPQTLQACKNDTCLNITVVEYEAHTIAPADYNEFKII